MNISLICYAGTVMVLSQLVTVSSIPQSWSINPFRKTGNSNNYLPPQADKPSKQEVLDVTKNREQADVVTVGDNATGNRAADKNVTDNTDGSGAGDNNDAGDNTDTGNNTKTGDNNDTGDINATGDTGGSGDNKENPCAACTPLDTNLDCIKCYLRH